MMDNKDEKVRFENAVSLGIVLPDTLRKAIQELSSDMHFSTQELKSEIPYVRFIAMITALEAVERLMESIPQFKRANLHLPFRELKKCLFLLKDGIEPPELTSMRAPKSETFRTKFFKMRCAVAMELLMDVGSKRLQAAKTVSKYSPKHKLKPETIANWRDKLIGNSTDPLAGHFQQITDDLKKIKLSEKAIAHFFRITTADQRGVHLKNQPHRAIGKR